MTPVTTADGNPLATLLAQTGADRVTLRLDVVGMNYPCIAEHVASGVPLMRTDQSIDQRAAATAQWVARNRRVLVQPDLEGADPAPPAALISVYHVRAQMLAPVLDAGVVAGWVSVHSQRGRPWSAAESEAIEHAAASVAADLDHWYAGTWQRPVAPPPPPYGPVP
jgi:maleate isomerase